MKPKSIASALHKILYIARIIMVIALIGLGVAVVAITLAFIVGPETINEIPGVSMEMNMETGVDKSDLRDLLEVIGVFVGFLIAYQVISRLIEILRSITREQPFEKENADRLSSIARALVAGQLIAILLTVTGLILRVGGDFNIDLSLLLGAAIAAVLADVFREGARLREEQEFTV